MIERGEGQPNPEQRVVEMMQFRGSHGLSKRIYIDHEDIGGRHVENPQVRAHISSEIVGAFESVSQADRITYHETKYPNENFAERWMRWEKSTVGWIASLREKADAGDSDAASAINLMRNLQLTTSIGNPPDTPSATSQQEDIAKYFVERIHDELEEKGKNENLDLSQADMRGAVIFYTTYLSGTTPEVRAHQREEFFGSVVRSLRLMPGLHGLQSEEDVTKAFAVLNKMAPLLRSFGLNAQDAMAALITARIHADSEMPQLQNASFDEALKPHEVRAAYFLKYGRHLQRQEADEDAFEGEEEQPVAVPLVEIMKMVSEPVATKEESKGYWIDGEIPTREEAIAELTARGNGLKDWERIEPFWTPHPTQNGVIVTNFKPAQDFQLEKNPDSRFAKLESLTDGDSGLLALAGVVAESPEKQAQLFQTLSGIVLAMHGESLKGQGQSLLGSFIDKQNTTGASLQFFGNERDYSLDGEVYSQLVNNGWGDYYTPRTEAYKIFEENNPEAYRQFMLKRQNYLTTSDFSSSPERLAKFSYVRDATTGAIQGIEVVKEPTVEEWKKRIGELKQAIDSGALNLEQIRQIEFLSHAVDIVGIMKWLQERGQEPNSHDGGDSPDSPADGQGQQAANPPVLASENTATLASHAAVSGGEQGRATESALSQSEHDAFLPPAPSESTEATISRGSEEISPEIMTRINELAERKADEYLSRRNAYLRALIEPDEQKQKQLLAYAYGKDEVGVNSLMKFFLSDQKQFEGPDFAMPFTTGIIRSAIRLDDDLLGNLENMSDGIIKRAWDTKLEVAAQERMDENFGPALDTLGVIHPAIELESVIARSGDMKLLQNDIDDLLKLQMEIPRGFTLDTRGSEIPLSISGAAAALNPEYAQKIGEFVGKLPTKMDQLYMIVQVYRRLQEFMKRKPGHYSYTRPDAPASGAVAIIHKPPLMEEDGWENLLPLPKNAIPSDGPDGGEGPGREVEAVDGKGTSEETWYPRQRRNNRAYGSDYHGSSGQSSVLA